MASMRIKNISIMKGSLVAKGRRFAIVVSRFNPRVTHRLLLGAVNALRRHGASPADIRVAWTPGAFEIPQAALRLARDKKFSPHAILCLGAVIRGETPHFDYICAEASRGLGQAALETGIPMAFGVLTTNTLKQAMARAGGKAGNKGWDAALAAMEMADLFAKWPTKPGRT